jgi:hypothetical protein
MADHPRRSIPSRNAARPGLERLEDRYLLSVNADPAGARAHLPTGSVAVLSGGALTRSSGEAFTVSAHPNATMARAGEGDSPAISRRSAPTPPDAAPALSGEADGRATSDAAASDLALAAPPAAQGEAIAASAAQASAAARASAGADATALDESSASSEGPGSAGSSPFGQGATSDEGMATLATAAGRPQDLTDAAGAADPGIAAPIGPAVGRDARSAAADPGLARVAVAMSPGVVPAMTADRWHAPNSSLAGMGPITGPYTRAPAGTQAADPHREPPRPSAGADLLAAFTPFDRAAVERAFDRFVAQLNTLETGLSRLGTTANLRSHLLATAGAIAVIEVFHRFLGRRRDEGGAIADGEENQDDRIVYYPGLPGLPYPWSLEEQ